MIKCYKFIVDILLMNFSCKSFQNYDSDFWYKYYSCYTGDSFRTAPELIVINHATIYWWKLNLTLVDVEVIW
jgi:hypothetical protein